MSCRLVYHAGRAALWVGDRVVDVARRSGGRFGPDPMQGLAEWPAFREWARSVEPGDEDPVCDEAALGPCVPRPRAVFAIGLNYRDHAEEAGLEIPGAPMVFTKFPSCLAGPHADVPLTSDRVDWEVELVVVIGRRARRVRADRAREVIAGCCVGQDISDRRVQFRDRPPQFSLGKSAEGFGPIGPALVALEDDFDPDALAITCSVSGERVQESRTSRMIFPVGALVEELSRFCTLEPGDLIFTGTPAGVGSVRTPRRYLAPGDVIESEIEGLGSLRNRCVPGAEP